MALTVEERNALLERTWALQIQRDFLSLVDLLTPVSVEELLAEPELGFRLALGWNHLGRWSEALEVLQELAEPCRRRGSDQVCRDRVNLEALMLMRTGRLVGAETLLVDLLEEAREMGDEKILLHATANLAVVLNIQCRWEEALASYQLARVMCQRMGERRVLGGIHNNLGIACRELALLNEADAHFQKALFHLRAVGSEDDVAHSEIERALLLNLMGDPRLAEATARRALRRFRDLGHTAGEGDCLRVLGIIVSGQGRSDEARGYLQDALGKVRVDGDRLAEAEVLEEMAVLDQPARNGAAASALTEAACAIYLELGAPLRAEKLRARLAALT